MLSSFFTRSALGLLSAATLSACVGYDPTDTTASAIRRPTTTPGPLPTPTFNLPSFGSGDLSVYAAALSHTGTYTPLTTQRRAAITTMVDSIHTASLNALRGTTAPDWCGARLAAANAGYALGRYFDTTMQRWILVGLDTTGYGQASFFFNPSHRRDLVVEAPHVYDDNTKLEGRTDTEGALIFQQTRARALLLNGADRCHGHSGASCGGNFSSTTVCAPWPHEDPANPDMRYRTADASHNDDTAFHVLHQRLHDVWTDTRFVQLHGNGNSDLESNGISVSDGRRWAVGSSGLASTFVANLQAPTVGGLDASAVNNCTDEDEILCGFFNAQARYSNNTTLACTGNVLWVGGTRFLHLEQRTGTAAGNLVDNPGPVISALQATFACIDGNCNAAAGWVPGNTATCVDTHI